MKWRFSGTSESDPIVQDALKDEIRRAAELSPGVDREVVAAAAEEMKYDPRLSFPRLGRAAFSERARIIADAAGKLSAALSEVRREILASHPEPKGAGFRSLAGNRGHWCAPHGEGGEYRREDHPAQCWFCRDAARRRMNPSYAAAAEAFSETRQTVGPQIGLIGK